jgi:hypothetical protein
VSVLDGIRARAGSATKVLFAEGCKITVGKQGWAGWYENNSKLADPLRPGEKTTVKFTLTPESLALWNEEMQPVVEPGEIHHPGGTKLNTDTNHEAESVGEIDP